METKSEIIIYETEDGSTAINVQLQEETVWLTQKQMSLLFDKYIMTVNEHIHNVFKEGELNEKSNVRKSLIVQNVRKIKKIV